MPEKKKQLRENLGSLILAVHNYGCKYAPTTRNCFLLKNLKAHFFYQKRPNDQKLWRKKTKINPKRFFSSKKFDDFLSIKKKSKIFLKKNCNGKKIDNFFGQKIDDFLKKVKIRLSIKTPKKIFRLRRAFFRGH